MTKPDSPEIKQPAKSVLDEQFENGKGSFFGHIRAYFLAGVLVTAPIGITLYLTWAFLSFIDIRVRSILPARYYEQYSDLAIPGVGILVAFIFFILIGWFAKNFLGRLILRLSEYVVHRVPVIRSVYAAVKQIFETVMTTQSQAFREVVMFEFPRQGIWAMGFVTGTTKGEVQRLTENEVVNVFFPTTPNPTSGFLLFIPRKDLVFMDMKVEEALKMIVSGGIVTPPDPSRLAQQGDGGK